MFECLSIFPLQIIFGGQYSHTTNALSQCRILIACSKQFNYWPIERPNIRKTIEEFRKEEIKTIPFSLRVIWPWRLRVQTRMWQGYGDGHSIVFLVIIERSRIVTIAEAEEEGEIASIDWESLWLTCLLVMIRTTMEFDEQQRVLLLIRSYKCLFHNFLIKCVGSKQIDIILWSGKMTLHSTPAFSQREYFGLSAYQYDTWS